MAENKLDRYVQIWAGLATVSAAALAFIQFALPQDNTIKVEGLDDLVQVLSLAADAASEIDPEAVTSEQGAALGRSVATLTDSLARTFPARFPGGDAFALKQGDAVELALPDGSTAFFGMGQLYSVHSYAYAGVGGDNRQLYIGEKMEFGPASSPCSVQLVSIDSSRAEGVFYFDC